MNATATQCPSCGAALADDQRYCLGCGSRQGEARVAYLEVLTPPSSAAAPAGGDPPPPAPRSDAISPALAAAAVGLAVLFLGVGVLVGRAGSDEAPQQAAKPTVVTVEGGVPAGSETAVAETNTTVSTFKSDWPAGQEGWTVQLQSLPKKGTEAADVEAAKKAATEKEAQDVGALDSDDFEALDAAQYVVYAGRFDSQAKANAALKDLRKDFSGARVIHVTDAAPVVNSAKAKADKAAVDALDSASGEDYAKQSQKLPDEVALPGKPPAKDGKEGGGGSGFESID